MVPSGESCRCAPVYCWGNTPCQSTIQSAIIAAGTGALIEVKQGLYPEAPTLTKTGTVTISGGWNSTFNDQTGTTSIYEQKSNGGDQLRCCWT